MLAHWIHISIKIIYGYTIYRITMHCIMEKQLHNLCNINMIHVSNHIHCMTFQGIDCPISSIPYTYSNLATFPQTPALSNWHPWIPMTCLEWYLIFTSICHLHCGGCLGQSPLDNIMVDSYHLSTYSFTSSSPISSFFLPFCVFVISGPPLAFILGRHFYEFVKPITGPNILLTFLLLLPQVLLCSIEVS